MTQEEGEEFSQRVLLCSTSFEQRQIRNMGFAVENFLLAVDDMKYLSFLVKSNENFTSFSHSKLHCKLVI